ncbi:MAG: Na+/H+ antiporter [Pseudomonadota bacterium]
MLHSYLIVAMGLAVLIAALSVAARRLRYASPILMLVGGGMVAFIPGLPPLRIDPDLVLLVFLPPLLYTSGVGLSWPGFRSNIRPILLLAIGCVLVTAGGVATAVHYLLGVSWPVGFVLGAIVSPPDAVAPLAVLRSMRLPRKLRTVLEGESLVNDATALVTLSFALAAAGSIPFSPSVAVLQFLAIVVAEIAFGITVGFAMLRLRHFVDDPRAEVLLALLTPFLAFWPPHAAGGSGVIACVAAGLYVSWNGRRLIRPATRLQGYFIWDLIVWGIEALLFLLAGLQARTVVSALTSDGWQRALAAAGLTCVLVIVIRFAWVYVGTYLPHFLNRSLGKSGVAPDWRQPFLVAFTGLRGAVSLAAALLIPAVMDGEPFPDRDLVLFATYSVIVVTLIGFGSTLPAIVRFLGVDQQGAAEAVRDKQKEREVRLEALDVVLSSIPGAGTSGSATSLRGRHQSRRDFYNRAVLQDTAAPDSGDVDVDELYLLRVEREAVAAAYEEHRLTDEARRRIERELDLEDARLRHAMESSGAKHRKD